MTVKELIDYLQQYDKDMAVVASWESVYAGFRPENFSVVDNDGRTDLEIDVENYG